MWEKTPEKYSIIKSKIGVNNKIAMEHLLASQSFDVKVG